MISLLTSTSTMLSIIMPMMKHPLSMGLILLLQTLTISLLSGNMNQNLWFSYILFLIMIGGMLILFMYMTSIASNEKFKTNLKIFIIPIMTSTMMILIMPLSKTNIFNNETIESNKTIEMTFTINKFMNFPLSMTFMFMMIYLLLCLIATVKITDFSQGSIRQMN